MSTRLSRFNSRLLCLGIVLALVLTTSAVFAQSIVSGEITGVVTDSSGAVVPNATVTLNSKEMGTTQTVTTNAAGGFRFPLLRPGVYTVSVKATGFSTATQDVTVGVGQVTTASLQLRVGTTGETIEVTGAAPLLETENANIATTYTPAQIENIPSPGGDLTNFALSTPGVVLSTGAGYFTAHGMPGTFESLHHQRRRHERSIRFARGTARNRRWCVQNTEKLIGHPAPLHGGV